MSSMRTPHNSEGEMTVSPSAYINVHVIINVNSVQGSDLKVKLAKVSANLYSVLADSILAVSQFSSRV